jgi:hypothetical protein
MEKGSSARLKPGGFSPPAAGRLRRQCAPPGRVAEQPGRLRRAYAPTLSIPGLLTKTKEIRNDVALVTTQ